MLAFGSASMDSWVVEFVCEVIRRSSMKKNERSSYRVNEAIQRHAQDTRQREGECPRTAFWWKKGGHRVYDRLAGEPHVPAQEHVWKPIQAEFTEKLTESETKVDLGKLAM